MKINKRNIAKILRESAFSPTEDPTLRIIVDVGNTAYYVSRALEEIRKGTEAKDLKELDSYLKVAISLLTLARINCHD